MKHFPVSTSTLSASALANFIDKQYNLPANSQCQLFRTGINHTYVVTSDELKYVFRVYSHGWRVVPEIEEELRVLSILKDNGISVSYPIPDKEGNLMQSVMAPEGTRYAALFSYAEGNKIRFMQEDTCFSIGQLMANMHLITSKQAIGRMQYDHNTLLLAPYYAAKRFFSEKLPEMQFLRQNNERIQARFEPASTQALARGIVHMDIWYDNMSVVDKDHITLFDFDFCGNGPLVLDIAYFSKQLFHIETDKDIYERKIAAFLKGYKSVRHLSMEEMDLIPDAGSAIWTFYLGVQADRFDWSNPFFTENYLKMFIGKMKDWLEYHK
mgnify:CR=1 FL=1